MMSQGIILRQARRGFASSSAASNVVTASKASNGVRVVSVNTGSPITSVNLVVQAGTRHEPSKGLAHVVRNLAFLGVGKDYNQVAAARDLELFNFSASTSREFTSYSAVISPGQTVSDYLSKIGSIISSKPVHWRVEDAKQRAADSLSETTTVDTYIDAAHRVAFRHNGLGNPLVLHNSSLIKASVESVGQFIGERYNTGSTIVVAAGGLEHRALVAAVESGLTSLPNGSLSTSAASTYRGGESTFVGTGPAHVVLAFEGVSLSGQDYFAAQVLRTLLGGESALSALEQNVVSKNNFVRYARAFNLAYTDSGLFGVYAVGDAGSAEGLAKAVAAQLRDLPSLVDNAEAFNRAKRQVLISQLSAFESNESTARTLVPRALANNLASGTDLVTEATKAVESLTPAVVKQVAASIVSKPLTLVGAGDVSHLPSVRQLSK